MISNDSRTRVESDRVKVNGFWKFPSWKWRDGRISLEEEDSIAVTCPFLCWPVYTRRTPFPDVASLSALEQNCMLWWLRCPLLRGKRIAKYCCSGTVFSNIFRITASFHDYISFIISFRSSYESRFTYSEKLLGLLIRGLYFFVRSNV